MARGAPGFAGPGPWMHRSAGAVAAAAVVAAVAVSAPLPVTAAARPRTGPVTPVASSVPSGSAAAGSASPRIWQPPQDVEWQWELDHPLDLHSATDMSTDVTAYDGATPPATDPTVYDIDGIANPASTVAALHALGDRVICYIEVGTAGNYYSAAQEGIPTTYYAQLSAAGDLGKKLSGYPERFLDINAPSTVAVVEAMIQQQCAAKGFDAVETDLDETFGGNEGPTGFTITMADEEAYLTTLAEDMHSLGLAWFSKNTDDTGSQAFVSAMEPLAQGTITEQAVQYATMALLAPYSRDGKPILDAEYSLARRAFCPADNAGDINGVLFPTSLDGGRKPCR